MAEHLEDDAAEVSAEGADAIAVNDHSLTARRKGLPFLSFHEFLEHPSHREEIRVKQYFCGLLAGLAVLAIQTQVEAADDWTKSKWGPKDEIGAANLISPASVLAASKLVKTGKTYNLGIVVDSKTPAFAPRTMSVTILQPNQISTTGLGPSKTTYNDDIFMGWFGIGPQIDGLGHIGIDHVYYNGH
ncbi:MAG: hypothetical protein GY948_13890, partial [Alphaproteobacteria bacterium]|nr:hypothetical protein [Alphaproteobacteria bacterium]